MSYSARDDSDFDGLPEGEAEEDPFMNRPSGAV